MQVRQIDDVVDHRYQQHGGNADQGRQQQSAANAAKPVKVVGFAQQGGHGLVDLKILDHGADHAVGELV